MVEVASSNLAGPISIFYKFFLTKDFMGLEDLPILDKGLDEFKVAEKAEFVAEGRRFIGFIAGRRGGV